jgi:hypothetical protein
VVQVLPELGIHSLENIPDSAAPTEQNVVGHPFQGRQFFRETGNYFEFLLGFHQKYPYII